MAGTEMSGRVPMMVVFDPVTELTLVEKLACAVGYSETWFEDLTLVIVAPSGMMGEILTMYTDLSHHECPLPQSYLGPADLARGTHVGVRWSVYLIHH
jgi:hypothetical protein